MSNLHAEPGAGNPVARETLAEVAARWQLETVTRTEGSAKTYATQLAQFEAWCRQHRLAWCPADAATVRAFVEARIQDGMQPQSGPAVIRAINAGHRALGLPMPIPQQPRRRLGKEPVIDRRFRQAAERMFDPGWRPPHLASSAPASTSTEVQRVGYHEATARELERRSMARKTLATYVNHVASFLEWCHRNRATPLPAEPDTVARYLGWYGTQARDGIGRSPSSLLLAVSAIRHVHHLQDLPSPTDHPRVKRVLRGHADSCGHAKRQARPLQTEEIRAICAYIDRKGGGSGMRDKALILLTYASCSRQSETTSRKNYDRLPDGREICLRIEDITFDRHGLTMRLTKTKTANAALEHLPAKYVSYGQDEATCPVTAVMAWIAAMRRYGVTKGPLFPRLKAVGDRALGEVRVLPEALSPNGLGGILKHYAALAELPEIDRVSGHSLRRGHVHEATRRKADLFEVADQGAWRSLGTVRIYASESNRKETNSSQKLGL